jgi:hypothetical protein
VPKGKIGELLGSSNLKVLLLPRAAMVNKSVTAKVLPTATTTTN